jgi:hypothetical protein
MLIDVMCCAYAAGCVMDFMFGVRSEFGGAKFAEVFSKTPPFRNAAVRSVCLSCSASLKMGEIWINFIAGFSRLSMGY